MRIIVKRFIEAISQFKKQFAAAISISFLYALLNVAIPMVLRPILSSIMDSGAALRILLLVFVLLAAVILSIFTNIRLYICLDSFGGLFVNSLENRLLDKLMNADMRSIDLYGPSRITHILYSDVLEMFKTIGHHLPVLISSCIVVTLSLILAAFIDYLIAIFLLCAVALGILISFTSRKLIYSASSETNLKMKHFFSVVQDFSQNIQTAKINNLSSYYSNKQESAVSDFIETSKKEDSRIYLYSGIEHYFGLVLEITLSLILALPSARTSIKDYVFFVFLYTALMNQSANIENLIHQITKSRICFNNVSSILNWEESERSQEITDINQVSIKDLTFAYEGKENCFRNFSLSLNKGESVFLEGKNGSGKTTLLKLLCGLYSTAESQILLNGSDVNAIKRADLNSCILFISQDERIIDEDLRTYLQKCSRRPISESKMDEVLEYVGLEKETGNGKDNARTLSGGQHKKLLFAKLLLNMEFCTMILIDELHAEMDEKTKERLNKTLNQICEAKDKILIVTSHEALDTVHFDKRINLN